MFHTSLLTKNLLFCLVVFSFPWGFSEVTSPSNVFACMIEEEDEGDPEEEQDPGAVLIDKKFQINNGGWQTPLDPEEQAHGVDFTQINGKATLQTRCKVKITIPPGSGNTTFTMRVKVKDAAGNEIHQETNSGTLQPRVNPYTLNPLTEIKVSDYTQNKLTVEYKIFLKPQGAEGDGLEMNDWTMTFNKN